MGKGRKPRRSGGQLAKTNTQLVLWVRLGNWATRVWRSVAKYRSHFFYVLALCAISAHFSVAYITNTKAWVSIADYTAGNASLPFQYRALTSWILRILIKVPGIRELAHAQPAPFDQPEILALTFLNFAGVMLATDLTRRSNSLYISDRNQAAVLAFCLPISLYFSYVALANTYRLSFVYDIPNVAIYATSVYAILGRRHFFFYLTFFVATLNRETSIFLLIIFFLYNFRSTRGELLRVGVHCLTLLVIWLAVKGFLAWLYAENSPEPGTLAGGMFMWQLGANLEFWFNPKYWPGLLSILGFLWIAVLAGWKYISNPDLKRTLWVTVFWFAGMFLVSLMTEVRQFGELTTLFSVVTAVIIHNYFFQGQTPKRPI